MAEKMSGKITQVIGAILDVRFDTGKLPEINEALEIPTRDGSTLVAEVAQHLGDDTTPVSYTHLDVYKRQAMSWRQSRAILLPKTKRLQPPRKNWNRRKRRKNGSIPA